MLLLGDRQIQQRRTGHFCRPPYVAAGFGPSHPLAGRSLEEGWRMVSEDTQNSGWLSVIHGLGDLCDLPNSGYRQMPTLLHESDNADELFEVVLLRSLQRVRLEERHNLGTDIFKPIDVETQQIFSVVVMSPVHVDVPASEECPEFL